MTSCRADVVRLLLQHSADVYISRPNFKESEDTDDDDIDGEPKEAPLSVGLITGNTAIIELLKSKGATATSRLFASAVWGNDQGAFFEGQQTRLPHFSCSRKCGMGTGLEVLNSLLLCAWNG